MEESSEDKTLKVKTALGSNKLVVVSNREPYIHERTPRGIECKRAIGGLVSTLDPMLQSCGGMWIAWGATQADFMVTDSQSKVHVPPKDPRYTLKRLRLSQKEISHYYSGFSNRTLWPIFTVFLEKAHFDREFWKIYQKVNEKFAQAVLEDVSRDDLIWVHDYHLSLVPRFLRDANAGLKIAFFWHIPWVPWEVFRPLHWRREILEGLLGSDLIGFHTHRYVKNFLECVEREKGLKASIDKKKSKIRLCDREIELKVFPVGIDYESFYSLGCSESVAKEARRLRQKLHGECLILGIDRLDYTKGILNKLEAFDNFLQRYPEFWGKVVLVQIAAPTRTRVKEYREMKREIDEIVGRINGKFQKIDWIPVRYFYRSFSKKELAALYRAADIALITPLADGMNLIAKEYIAARGSEEGVLILSEFAGASEELNQALLVNPYNIDGIAETIKKAIEIPSNEKKERFKILKQKAKRHDVYWWLHRFFEEWRKIYD